LSRNLDGEPVSMLAGFSAGLVIYWAWNNTLSVMQQAFIMNKHGTKIELWDNVKETLGLKKKGKEPAE
jgi:YidC/Oxa1 family membrane protein insertase